VVHVTGEIELEDKVLVIRRIQARFTLRGDAGQRGISERVLGFHSSCCPVYRSLRAGIAITSELQVLASEPAPG
jgi:uncharacterized OsmC-like protein